MLLKWRYPLIVGIIAGLLVVLIILIKTASNAFFSRKDHDLISGHSSFSWQPPDPRMIPDTKEGELIRYGKELISNTSYYLGPKGKVASITNGMNCQNCHLDAGTRYLGNNYGGVYSTYPKFRERSGSIENIYKRVSDCLERSLNAEKGIDSNSREMQAISSYIKWLGQDVPKGTRPAGTGIADLKFMKRPADPSRGESVYLLNCKRCHGANGEGKLNPDSVSYEFPPLWGEKSFTTAAGLFRLSRLAGYIRHNMPFDVKTSDEKLTDKQAWDVAAFIAVQPRPEKNYKEDWPDISGKPFDYPYGPYADGFSEKQHKYGPFKEIMQERNKKLQRSPSDKKQIN